LFGDVAKFISTEEVANPVAAEKPLAVEKTVVAAAPQSRLQR